MAAAAVLVTGVAVASGASAQPSGAGALTVVGPSDQIAPGSTAAFTAKVTDASGDGIEGAPVTFSASDPSVLPRATHLTTRADGTARITITIRARTRSTGGSITAGTGAIAAPNKTATAYYTVGKNIGRVQVAGTKCVAAGGIQKIAVRVWNADGGPARRATVSLVVDGPNGGASGTATTGPAGQPGRFAYRTTYAGTDTVTAIIDAHAASTKVETRPKRSGKVRHCKQSAA